MSKKYDGSQKKTMYNGTIYDSQLEAQYAVFFDDAGIAYTYHPGEYHTGTFYCGDEIIFRPDFYLRCLEGKNLFCEIKPEGSFLNENLEVQRKISAAMVNEATPVYGGLLILGPFANFHKDERKRMQLSGDALVGVMDAVLKTRWRIRGGDPNKETNKTFIEIEEPNWDADKNFSSYPMLPQNITAVMALNYSGDGASEPIYKAFCNAMYAPTNKDKHGNPLFVDVEDNWTP